MIVLNRMPAQYGQAQSVFNDLLSDPDEQGQGIMDQSADHKHWQYNEA